MSGTGLITSLAAQGISLSNNCGKLRVEGQAHLLTDELRDVLVSRKPELLAILRAADEAADSLVLARMQGDGRYVASNARRQPVIDLLLPVYRRDPDLAEVLRDAWMERVAICEIEGAMGTEDAEAMAIRELEIILAFDISNGYDLADGSNP